MACEVTVDGKTVAGEKPFPSRHLDVTYDQRPTQSLLDLLSRCIISQTSSDMLTCGFSKIVCRIQAATRASCGLVHDTAQDIVVMMTMGSVTEMGDDIRD